MSDTTNRKRTVRTTAGPRRYLAGCLVCRSDLVDIREGSDLAITDEHGFWLAVCECCLPFVRLVERDRGQCNVFMLAKAEADLRDENLSTITMTEIEDLTSAIKDARRGETAPHQDPTEAEVAEVTAFNRAQDERLLALYDAHVRNAAAVSRRRGLVAIEGGSRVHDPTDALPINRKSRRSGR